MINLLNDSVKSLIYLCLACSLIVLLLNKNKYIKNIKFVCGVIILSLCIGILSPVYNVMIQIITIDFTLDEDIVKTDEYNNKLITESAKQISNNIKLLIKQRYGIDETSLSVNITLNTNDIENILIKSVHIKIKTDIDDDKAKEIAKYISDALCTDCTVYSE